jgi:hypothetical protein
MKKNCIFRICMLKLDEGHMNVIHVQMMNYQDLIRCFHYYELHFNGYIYIYKQKHGSHINTFKKDKINDSFKIIYFLFFLKNSLH